MGDGSHKKRKRTEDVQDEKSEQPPTKIRSKERDAGKQDNKDSKDAGKARQLKSERRSKKTLNQSKEDVPQPTTANSAESVDDLAKGADFVALSAGGNKTTNPSKSEDSTKEGRKDAKKSSPRSIRKAAKFADATIAKYGQNSVKGDNDTNSSTESKDPGNAVGTNEATKASSATPARFICFVGNLPFTATTEQIKSHFSKLSPKSIRHSTDKTTGKSKGFAFLEFDSFDRMKTCLKLYHHSIFDPARTALNGGEVIQETEENKKTLSGSGRKLNVELTAGGGGNTKGRRDKIREKNGKLREERARRKVEEKKEVQEKVKKRREQNEKEQRKRSRKGPTGANAEAMRDNRGVHPSRLNRVPQAV